jgi:TM2 domain-containing membrane protein YozV
LYPDASIAYEQIVFDHQNDETIKAQALLKKSYCYKSEGKYSLIDNLLKRCDVNKLNDSIKALILFEQAFACYMDEKFELAKERILPVLNLNATPEMDKASVLLYSLILNELNCWEESKNNLVSFIKRTDIKDETLRDSLIQEVNTMYQKKNIPHLKKVKTARLMSFIIPGSGQMYAGQPGKGLISLSLVALSSTFIYFNIVDQIYTSSAMGVYLFSFFYTGNVNQTHDMVKKRNNTKKNTTNTYLRKQITGLNNQIK